MPLINCPEITNGSNKVARYYLTWEGKVGGGGGERRELGEEETDVATDSG